MGWAHLGCFCYDDDSREMDNRRVHLPPWTRMNDGDGFCPFPFFPPPPRRQLYFFPLSPTLLKTKSRLLFPSLSLLPLLPVYPSCSHDGFRSSILDSGHVLPPALPHPAGPTDTTLCDLDVRTISGWEDCRPGKPAAKAQWSLLDDLDALSSLNTRGHIGGDWDGSGG